MKPGLPRFLFWTLALFLSGQTIRHLSLSLQHPYPLEYGEGVNYLWSQRAGAGESIYPQISEQTLPQLHNPYPPLYPLLSAGVSRLGFDDHAFYAGRTLSLFGLILATLAIYAIIKRRTSVGPAFLGSLLFLLSPMILRFGVMMRVDSLALGFSLQALNLLDQKKIKSAALFAALAIGVKPSYLAVALLLAVIAIRSKDLKSILRTALCGALPLLILLLWMQWMPGSDWVMHLSKLQGLPPDWPGLCNWFARFAGQHAPLLTLAVLAFGQSNPLLKAYSGLLLLPLVLTAWISGSQENYLMELWAATCLLSACAWPAFKAGQPRAAWLFLLLQLGLFYPVAPAPVFTRTYGQEIPAGQNALLSPTASDLEIGQLLVAELASLPGPILSADLGYLLQAAQEPLYQPYQFEKLRAAGKWSPQALQDAIKSSTFSAILLKGLAENADDPTFNADTQQAIHIHYVLHRVLGPWHLYLRK
jgi:hypothetical protein